MKTKVYLRITVINGILILLIIAFNIAIHIPGEIEIALIDGSQVITATKKFGEYFNIVSLVSTMLIFLILLLSLIYMFFEHKKVSNRLNKLVNAFETANGQPIIIEKSNFKDNELEIINAWNANITELNELNEKRDNYFKRMIHDFKAPMHVIKANLKLFGLDHPEGDEYIDIVIEEVANLERDIENFLVLEKIDYFEKKNNHLMDIKSLIDPLKIAYSTKGMEFVIEYKTNDTQIVADQVMLRRIIDNLVENAYKYSNNCRIKIIVYAGYISFENNVDTGLAINNIFATNTRNYSQSGNGLGVSIIKKYVEINGFDIYSEKKDDVFIVNLILDKNCNSNNTR